MTPVDDFDDDATLVTRHAYPSSAMTGDYLRAAAGLVPSSLILVTMPVDMFGGVAIGGFAAIFGVFALRTFVRHGTRIEMTESELRSSGLWRMSLPWDELDRMKLGYYSTRRDRRAGWMQLELGTPRARLRLDSRIEGFDELVRRATAVASRRGLALSAATVSNLQALGIKLPDVDER